MMEQSLTQDDPSVAGDETHYDLDSDDEHVFLSEVEGHGPGGA